MRMKSYFAPTVEFAMEQARREMGPEALLVNSRKAPPEAQGLGEYEVVFATLPEGQDESQATAGVETASRLAAPAEDPVARELARLRKQMEEMGSALAGLNEHACTWAVPAPEFAAIFSRLLEDGFSLEDAKRIVKQAHAQLDADPASWSRWKTPFDSDSIERAVRKELEYLVSVDAQLGDSDGRARVVALVGPPGSGKTTTLVKLAVRYGLASSRPVHLISADTHRVAAVEQLRAYAAIIGAGFDAVETTKSLQQVIEAHREKSLILIDTPGYAAGDMEEGSGLAHFLSHQRGVETHLVAPASMRAGDLGRAIDRFEIFAPAKLIFTRLDETSAFGAIVSESARTGKPVSFLASGQQIPEDIEPATAGRLLELVFERPREQALSAA
jgi:flagellar biosynthesis protein FlhF